MRNARPVGPAAWFVGVLALVLVAAAPAGASLVATGAKCQGQQNTHASDHLQQEAMKCLINYARNRAGMGDLRSHRALERAAGRKARDVMSCGFSHTACGNPPDLWSRRYGYMSGAGQWRWGENLAWGRGKRGSARMIFKAWLQSPPHRAAIFTASFEHMGLGLRRGSFNGNGNAAVWALELGCRGC
jgi:uncharacterized protein YkwD